MIEKYFKQGIRFKWACPGADPGKTRDGSIIDNPPRALSPLVYDGVDGELDSGGTNVTTLGFSMRMNIPYNWLVYAHGHTTRLSTAGDILTGPMSGCLITTWTDKGGRFVGHVGTIESDESVNKKVKTQFAAHMPPTTTGFNPANAWDPGEIALKMGKFKKMPTPKIIALVTPGNEFHAILMFALQGVQNEWCCGGIKKVAPMNYGAIKAKLS